MLNIGLVAIASGLSAQALKVVVQGVHGAVFSLVLVFSLYVVFEAAGLRQEVGKQAEVLNDLMDRMITTHRLDHTRLRELVGHTWAEVAGGFVFGAVFAYVALH